MFGLERGGGESRKSNDFSYLYIQAINPLSGQHLDKIVLSIETFSSLWNLSLLMNGCCLSCVSCSLMPVNIPELLNSYLERPCLAQIYRYFSTDPSDSYYVLCLVSEVRYECSFRLLFKGFVFSFNCLVLRQHLTIELPLARNLLGRVAWP